MTPCDIANAFRLKAVSPWTIFEVGNEIKLCRIEGSKECNLLVVGTVRLLDRDKFYNIYCIIISYLAMVL